ncbi:MAG: ribosome recycling factor [Verrucomicrobiota bacterium]
MTIDEVLFEAEEKMEKTAAKVHEDFASVRTGKASPALVENLRVDCYGTSMRLRELAGITAPEPRMVMIQPWDASNVDPIRKAIEGANIGIAPLVDGKIIRLPIPELSEERRKEMTKLIGKMAEDSKVAIRHIRRDAMDAIKKSQKESKVTEDDLERCEKEIQHLTDTFTKKIDEQFKHKEAELMKV